MDVKLPIETDRLVLRDRVEDDWEAIMEFAADPQAVKFMGWGPNSEEETKKFIQDSIARQKADPRLAYDFAIVLKETGKLIGGGGVIISSPEHKQGWIGYIINREVWGQGIATEASNAFLELGFAQLGLHRIYATVDPGNTASVRVLEKLGMRREALFLENKFEKGAWRNEYLYAILEQEWN